MPIALIQLEGGGRHVRGYSASGSRHRSGDRGQILAIRSRIKDDSGPPCQAIRSLGARRLVLPTPIQRVKEGEPRVLEKIIARLRATCNQRLPCLVIRLCCCRMVALHLLLTAAYVAIRIAKSPRPVADAMGSFGHVEEEFRCISFQTTRLASLILFCSAA